MQLSNLFCLCKCYAKESNKHPCRHRNICVVLGCIAEKLAGPASIPLLTPQTLDYLIALLVYITLLNTYQHLVVSVYFNPVFPSSSILNEVNLLYSGKKWFKLIIVFP